MDVITNVINHSGTDMPVLNSGFETAGADDLKIVQNDGLVTKARRPLGPTITDKVATDQERGDVPKAGELSPEVINLLTELDPNDKDKFRNPRYFIQLARRRGFRYHYTDAKGKNQIAAFDTGVFVTFDRALVYQLSEDIKRPDGISHIVAEVSADNYTKIAQTAKQYSHIAGTAMVSSDAANPAAATNRTEMDALRRTIADQQKTIETMRANSGEVLTDTANTARFNWGNGATELGFKAAQA